jgi:hypothetical protein
MRKEQIVFSFVFSIMLLDEYIAVTASFNKKQKIID